LGTKPPYNQTPSAEKRPTTPSIQGQHIPKTKALLDSFEYGSGKAIGSSQPEEETVQEEKESEAENSSSEDDEEEEEEEEPPKSNAKGKRGKQNSASSEDDEEEEEESSPPKSNAKGKQGKQKSPPKPIKRKKETPPKKSKGRPVINTAEDDDLNDIISSNKKSQTESAQKRARTARK
jgi:hypothetical protein